MNRVLAEECQKKFIPLERPKTRVSEIEEEVKEFEGQVKKKEEYHLYSFRLAGRTGEASDGEDGGDNASSAGLSDLKNPPGKLGPGVSALHGKLGF